MATNKKNTRIYSDLDLDFKAHPLNGDVAMKYNEDAVRRAIYHIVMTNTYDRPFQPHIGANIRELLFEQPTMAIRMSLQKRIKHLIISNEPRANVIDIQVTNTEDLESYEIDVIFSTLNIVNPISTKLFLTRVR